MRILHTADLHLGTRTHDPLGRWRHIEAARVLDELIAIAHDEKCGAIVVSGDVYDRRTPQPWAIDLFDDFCFNVGGEVEVYVIGGNHDTHTTDDLTDAIALASESDNLQPGPCSRLLDTDVVLFALPYFGSAQVAAYARLHDIESEDVQSEVVAALMATLREHLDPKHVNLLMLHGTVDGAAWNSEAQPTLGETREYMFPQSTFEGFDFVLAGHIHKPQQVGDVVYYPGSPIRTDFGDEERRYVGILDTGSGTYTWRPLETPTRFATHTVEMVYADDGPGTMRADVLDGDDATGAVVRLKGALPLALASDPALAAWEREVREAGALHVAKPAITYERVQALGMHGIEIDTDPREALAEYCDLVGGSYADERDTLLGLHDALADR